MYLIAVAYKHCSVIKTATAQPTNHQRQPTVSIVRTRSVALDWWFNTSPHTNILYATGATNRAAVDATLHMFFPLLLWKKVSHQINTLITISNVSNPRVNAIMNHFEIRFGFARQRRRSIPEKKKLNFQELFGRRSRKSPLPRRLVVELDLGMSL